MTCGSRKGIRVLQNRKLDRRRVFYDVVQELQSLSRGKSFFDIPSHHTVQKWRKRWDLCCVFLIMKRREQGIESLSKFALPDKICKTRLPGSRYRTQRGCGRTPPCMVSVGIYVPTQDSCLKSSFRTSGGAMIDESKSINAYVKRPFERWVLRSV